MGTLKYYDNFRAEIGSSAMERKFRFWPVLAFSLLLAAAPPLLAQASPEDPAEKQPPLFSLINVVKTEGPLKVSLGGEPVGIGEMPFGFYTGLVNWYPTMPISLEAEGFEPTEIPLPDGAKDANLVPLYVVFDSKKPRRPGEQPVPTIEWAKIPPAANRSQTYLDVINLTEAETLEADVAGSKVVLPRRKRVRVSNQASANVRILPDGPEISVAAAEGGGVSQMLALIYAKPDGTLDYAIASEPSVQR
jgi:hypothetical protein